MKLYFIEMEIVLILNCINYSMYMVSKNENTIGKRELINYFRNFEEDYFNLNVLYGKISTEANKKYYNLKKVKSNT